MKIKELRELTKDELVARRGELKKEALDARLMQASGQLENPARFRLIRKEVARIETILSERRLNLQLRAPRSGSAAPKAAAPAAEAAPARKAPAKKAATKKSTAKKAASKD